MIIEACCMGTFRLLRFQIKFGKCRNLLLLFEQFTAQVASKSKKSINNATTPHV